MKYTDKPILTTAKLYAVAKTELPAGVRLMDLQRSAVARILERGGSIRKFARDNGISERFATQLIQAHFGDEIVRLQEERDFARIDAKCAVMA